MSGLGLDLIRARLDKLEAALRSLAGLSSNMGESLLSLDGARNDDLVARLAALEAQFAAFIRETGARARETSETVRQIHALIATQKQKVQASSHKGPWQAAGMTRSQWMKKKQAERAEKARAKDQTPEDNP